MSWAKMGTGTPLPLDQTITSLEGSKVQTFLTLLPHPHARRAPRPPQRKYAPKTALKHPRASAVLCASVNRHSIVHYFRYIHTVLLVYCLYPLHNIVLCLSIFMTVALSMERFKGELFKELLSVFFKIKCFVE